MGSCIVAHGVRKILLPSLAGDSLIYSHGGDLQKPSVVVTAIISREDSELVMRAWAALCAPPRKREGNGSKNGRWMTTGLFFLLCSRHQHLLSTSDTFGKLCSQTETSRKIRECWSAEGGKDSTHHTIPITIAPLPPWQAHMYWLWNSWGWQWNS